MQSRAQLHVTGWQCCQLVLLLAVGAHGQGIAVLPTVTPTFQPMTAAVAALPGAAALPSAFQTAQAIPAIRQVPAGSCSAVFAPGQQCGGNMTNPTSNCTQFGSCDNDVWAGGCCPASFACTGLESSGNVCWSCGGKQPTALAAASENAGGYCCSYTAGVLHS
ncbi:hypothetical protein COO60DRAFT_956335 [Scenedesmus sp. NREL 46B-D3]|nr:hypothetical protein COO60DRAFT_956335 [Scenedesmus sp. NREL 46B-D3]